MIAACKSAVSIPVFVMIRPRGGNFVYSDTERDVMLRDIVVARELGADGIVIGCLRTDHEVDVELVRLMVESANELPVTFHRAFDFTPNLEASLESLAASGVQRVLTSGGARTAGEGVEVLAGLVRQADSRLVVMAGGGIREHNVHSIVSAGVREVHVSLTRLERGGEGTIRSGVRLRKALPEDDAAWEVTDAERVRSFVGNLGGESSGT